VRQPLLEADSGAAVGEVAAGADSVAALEVKRAAVVIRLVDEVDRPVAPAAVLGVVADSAVGQADSEAVVLAVAGVRAGGDAIVPR
jgi:hypothetical protein